MTVSITRIKTPRGDMQYHVAGCADVDRKRAYRDEGEPDVYTGDTIVDAIVEADTDMASWFGLDVYDPDAEEQAWTVRLCEVAPCMKSLLRGVTFDALGRPAFEAPSIPLPVATGRAAAGTIRRVQLACGHRDARRIVVGSHEDDYARLHGTVGCRICRGHAAIVGWVDPMTAEQRAAHEAAL